MALRGYDDYLAQAQFHDCYLEVQGELVPAHRFFLATLEYFRARFQSEMRADVKKNESDGLPVYKMTTANLTGSSLRLWLSHIYKYGGWSEGVQISGIGCPCEKQEDGEAVVACYRLSHYVHSLRLIDHFRSKSRRIIDPSVPSSAATAVAYYDMLVSGEYQEGGLRYKIMKTLWSSSSQRNFLLLNKMFPERALTQMISHLGIVRVFDSKEGISKLVAVRPDIELRDDMDACEGATAVYRNGELILFYYSGKLNGDFDSWEEKLVGDMMFTVKTKHRNGKLKMAIGVRGTPTVPEPDIGKKAVVALDCSQWCSFLHVDSTAQQHYVEEEESLALVKKVRKKEEKNIIEYKVVNKFGYELTEAEKKGQTKVWVQFAWYFNRDEVLPLPPLGDRERRAEVASEEDGSLHDLDAAATSTEKSNEAAIPVGEAKEEEEEEEEEDKKKSAGTKRKKPETPKGKYKANEEKKRATKRLKPLGAGVSYDHSKKRKKPVSKTRR